MQVMTDRINGWTGSLVLQAPSTGLSRLKSQTDRELASPDSGTETTPHPFNHCEVLGQQPDLSGDVGKVGRML